MNPPRNGSAVIQASCGPRMLDPAASTAASMLPRRVAGIPLASKTVIGTTQFYREPVSVSASWSPGAGPRASRRNAGLPEVARISSDERNDGLSEFGPSSCTRMRPSPRKAGREPADDRGRSAARLIRTIHHSLSGLHLSWSRILKSGELVGLQRGVPITADEMTRYRRQQIVLRGAYATYSRSLATRT